MTEDDRLSFIEAWGATFAAQNRRLPTEAAVSMAFAALQDVELEDVKKALYAHLRDPDRGQHAVTVADVMRHIDGGTDARKAQAAVAWRQVETAMRQIGSYESVLFEDAQIHRAIDALGGWVKLCRETKETELKWLKIEFEKLYVALSKDRPYPSLLPGRVALDPQTEKAPEPKTIGNLLACHEVYRHGQKQLEDQT